MMGTRSSRPSEETAASAAARAPSDSSAMVKTIPGRTTPEVRGRTGSVVWFVLTVPPLGAHGGRHRCDALTNAHGELIFPDSTFLVRGFAPTVLGSLCTERPGRAMICRRPPRKLRSVRSGGERTTEWGFGTPGAATGPPTEGRARRSPAAGAAGVGGSGGNRTGGDPGH